MDSKGPSSIPSITSDESFPNVPIECIPTASVPVKGPKPVIGKNTKARINQSCFIDTEDCQLLKKVRDRICQIHNWEKNKTEKFQFAFYDVGDFYHAHYDAFDIKNITSLSSSIRDSGQRIITNIIYLNSTSEGGDTYFPRLNLSIKPKSGNLLAFQNCIEGTNFLNPYSIHESKKVLKGKKWILSLWLRES